MTSPHQVSIPYYPHRPPTYSHFLKHHLRPNRGAGSPCLVGSELVRDWRVWGDWFDDKFGINDGQTSTLDFSRLKYLFGSQIVSISDCNSDGNGSDNKDEDPPSHPCHSLRFSDLLDMWERGDAKARYWYMKDSHFAAVLDRRRYYLNRTGKETVKEKLEAVDEFWREEDSEWKCKLIGEREKEGTPTFNENSCQENNFAPFYETPSLFKDDWINGYYANLAPEDRKEEGEDFRFVYIGPAGTTVTPLHRDVYTSHSFSTNLHGRKLWTLYPPSYRPFLYSSFRFSATTTNAHPHKIPCPCPPWSSYPFQFTYTRSSETVFDLRSMKNDAHDMGWERWDGLKAIEIWGDHLSRLKNEKERRRETIKKEQERDDDEEDDKVFLVGKEGLKIIQEEGETIFVPSGWWHQVENLPPSPSSSSSSSSPAAPCCHSSSIPKPSFASPTPLVLSLNHNWSPTSLLPGLFDSLVEEVEDVERMLADVREMILGDDIADDDHDHGGRGRRGGTIDIDFEKEDAKETKMKEWREIVRGVVRKDMGWDYPTFFKMILTNLHHRFSPSPSISNESNSASTPHLPFPPPPPLFTPDISYTLSTISSLVQKFLNEKKFKQDREWSFCEMGNVEFANQLGLGLETSGEENKKTPTNGDGIDGGSGAKRKTKVRVKLGALVERVGEVVKEIEERLQSRNGPSGEED